MVISRWQESTSAAARRARGKPWSRPSWHQCSRFERREYLKSNYSAVSLAEAVRQLLPKAEVTAVSGTGVVPKEPTDIPAAVAAARNADVVILAVGGRSAWSNERTEGEGSDTANKDLPPQQVELIDAVTALGKPTVAVVSIGGPYALASVSDKLPAVITDYYGGPYQATAIADAIFGVTNPGGKLPFTLPRHVGQMPIHCARNGAAATGGRTRISTRAISTCRRRRCSPSATASATRRSRTEPLTLASETVDVNGEARVSLTVTNTGKLHGTRANPEFGGSTWTSRRRSACRSSAHSGFARRPGATRSCEENASSEFDRRMAGCSNARP